MENEQRQQLHPMAKSIIDWTNDALTLTEAEMRVALIESVVNDLKVGIENFKAQQEQEVTE